MSPTEARSILDRSQGIPQRAVAEDRVLRFVHAIQSGQWKLTHQPVALDPSGVCFDGQHRLSAIARAGQTVPILVAYDADPETFDVIDTGAARSAAATARIAGYANTSVLTSAVRLLLMYEAVVGTNNRITGRNRNVITSADVMAFLGSPRGDLLMSMQSPAERLCHGLGRSGFRAHMIVALLLIRESGASEALTDEFEDRVARGTMLADDSPLLALRRWLISDNGYSRLAHNDRAQGSLLAILKAWNLWVRGDTRQYIRAVPGVDSMPRPIGSRPEAADVA